MGFRINFSLPIGRGDRVGLVEEIAGRHGCGTGWENSGGGEIDFVIYHRYKWISTGLVVELREIGVGEIWVTTSIEEELYEMLGRK